VNHPFLTDLSALVVLSVLAPPTFASDVLVVDDVPGPGVDFDQIYLAVDAAHEGDTILVKAGSYIATEIDGKSLVVTAEVGEDVFVSTEIVVRNLAANQSVLVRGIDITPNGVQSGLRVEDSQGPVWLEDMRVRDSYIPTAVLAGIEVRNSTDVTVVRSTLAGNRAVVGVTDAGPGLLAVNSDVSVFECELSGGIGSSSPWGEAQAGPGARVEGGRLYAAGSSLLGGSGGSGSGPFGCGDGVDGAAGLLLASGSPTARRLDCDVRGGAPGTTTPPCVPGNAGPVESVLSGSSCVDPFSARGLTIGGPVRTGQPLVATVRGAPGDRVFLSVSPSHAPTWFQQKGKRLVGGVFLPDLASDFVVELGVLDATGNLQVTAPAPPVSSARTFYCQAIHFSASAFGEVVFSSGAVATVLDPAY